MRPRDFLLISSTLILFIFFIDSILIFNTPTNIDISPIQFSVDTQMRIFIGIYTTADRYDRRHLLRLIYGTQTSLDAHIDVRFMICNLITDDQRILVSLEILKFNDVIILDCTENINDGKIYTYFSSLPRLLKSNSTYPPYHYVMKADDDAYIRLPYLVESLKPLPREDMYYGYINTVDGVEFMTGTFYILSWDIVEWISVSDISKRNTRGPEDVIVGKWLRNGHLGKNRYNMREEIYDMPGPGSGFPHEFWPGTIAVHKLKTQERWIKALDYFNVSKNLGYVWNRP